VSLRCRCLQHRQSWVPTRSAASHAPMTVLTWHDILISVLQRSSCIFMRLQKNNNIHGSKGNSIYVGRRSRASRKGFARSEYDNKIRCSVECDGGGVNLIFRDHDVMMYLDRIRVVTDCDSNLIDGSDELTGGKDDKVFRLNRVGAAVCRAIKIP
jgi:hypothetical protein